jgi:hypothetical protein
MSEIVYYVAYAQGLDSIHNRAFRDYGECRDWIDAVKKYHKVDMKYVGAPVTDNEDMMFRLLGPLLMETKYPRKFQITSGKMRATDPCYSKDINCGVVLHDVMNGDWRFKLVWSDQGDWGVRVKEIIVWNEAVLDAKKVDKISFIEVDNNYIGVDSGQAGFFDEDLYPDNGSEDKQFYHKIGEGTLSPRSVGIVPFGVASSSGFGDGGYPLYTHRNKDGKLIAAKIDYMPPDEDENADDEDETALSE